MVRLRLTNGADGSVKDVGVISGNALLTKAAIDAVRQGLYKPYVIDGRPTEVETEAAINFTLGG